MKKIILASAALFILAGCQTTPEQVAKMLKENPNILADAIKANPAEFMKAVESAAQESRKVEEQRRAEQEKKQLEDSYSNPLKPTIRKDELFRGPADAQLTLVEYSDFECPFCSRGYGTVNELLAKYKGKIRFVYKHLPLSFHPNAMPASKYFEAIRLQDGEKAWKFHDELYKNQSKLKLGDKFLKSVAKDLKVDMAKLAKDVNSAAVQKRIDEDLAEAKKFGFQGTPGFLLNGIPVKGAYPADHFVGIVEELVKRNKVKL